MLRTGKNSSVRFGKMASEIGDQQHSVKVGSEGVIVGDTDRVLAIMIPMPE